MGCIAHMIMVILFSTNDKDNIHYNLYFCHNISYFPIIFNYCEMYLCTMMF